MMQLVAACATAFYIVPFGSTAPGASAWSLASSFSSSSAISISMMASTDKRKQPGTRAKLEDYSDFKFAKQQTTSDGACFIVSDDESPDPTRSWFYCDDPALEDEDMVCELVPEWMGSSPSGDHAVWLCSKPKPE